MTRPRPLPPTLGASFSTAQALAAGVTPRRLRAKDLVSPFRGTRSRHPALVSATSDPDDPFAEEHARRHAHIDRMRLFTRVMEPGTFFSGRTAAYAYGAPIDPDGVLHVATFAPRRAPLRRGIKGHKVASHLATVVVHNGMPMTSPASTWAMLARELSVRELVIVGDWFVHVPRDRYGTPQPSEQLTTIAELHESIEAGPRVGRRKLREALEMIRVGSSSPLETEYRLEADAAELPVPELDYEVFSASGRRIGISEIAYAKYRVVVEIEGDHHRTSRKQWNRDIEKYQAYADAGWQPVRLTSTHLRRPDHGMSIVADTLRRRGWDGRPEPR